MRWNNNKAWDIVIDAVKYKRDEYFSVHINDYISDENLHDNVTIISMLKLLEPGWMTTFVLRTSTGFQHWGSYSPMNTLFLYNWSTIWIWNWLNIHFSNGFFYCFSLHLNICRFIFSLFYLSDFQLRFYIYIRGLQLKLTQ